MRETLIVAFLFFITSIDSILLIFSAIQIKRHPHPRAARLLVFATLASAHPIYCLAADTMFRLPGLRLVSAVGIVFFALRLAGESQMSFRAESVLPKRTIGAIVGTTLWLDALTSVDTSVLVSAASPSLFVTFAGNLAATTALVLLGPRLYGWITSAPWTQIAIAAVMSFSAVLQLRVEPLLGAARAPEALFPAAVALLAATAAYGWKRHYG
ncbi:hypothetical protein [Paenibacillus sp.]|uniref:hypothetical protein n=1 Tax=Paenibacillus sp. TaxID=58172 RepID=UPI002D6FFC0F|nr:hypothetical protein [Paenibacillus sp.]HZG84956.1 hypothetical protein [Paenibacillus sp.]